LISKKKLLAAVSVKILDRVLSVYPTLIFPYILTKVFFWKSTD